MEESGRARPVHRRGGRRAGVLAVLSGGAVVVTGCLATLQQNLDLILSPGAVQNALVTPYSNASGLVELFVRLFRS